MRILIYIKKIEEMKEIIPAPHPDAPLLDEVYSIFFIFPYYFIFNIFFFPLGPSLFE